jgi:hypothetical protein
MKTITLIHFILILFSVKMSAQSETVELLRKYPKAQEVKTGIYLINIYELNINTHSFNADFYIWFKWKGDLDPTNIEFTNAVQKWGITQVPFYEEPVLLDDGNYYYGMRFESRFNHAFELADFPLDRHILKINIENSDYPIDSIIYVPDISEKAYKSEKMILPGWIIEKVVTKSQQNLYKTDFGEGKSAREFSDFTLELTMARPISYFLLKLLLPLLIVILVTLGGLFISAVHTDARMSVPIGSLLAVVFLQQSYSDALPDVGYMVLMDKIYLLVYLMLLSILFRIMFVANRMAKNPSKEEILKIMQKDSKLVMLFFLFLLIGTSVLLLF